MQRETMSRAQMFRKLSSSTDSVGSSGSSSSLSNLKCSWASSRWCRKNCQHCNMVFCGQGDFCTHECRLSFSVRDYPAEAIDQRLQDIGGLACRFEDSL